MLIYKLLQDTVCGNMRHNPDARNLKALNLQSNTIKKAFKPVYEFALGSNGVHRRGVNLFRVQFESSSGFSEAKCGSI